MTINELDSKIKAEFPKDIYGSRIVNGNELYLEIEPEHIMQLSMYLKRRFGLRPRLPVRSGRASCFRKL